MRCLFCLDCFFGKWICWELYFYYYKCPKIAKFVFIPQLSLFTSPVFFKARISGLRIGPTGQITVSTWQSEPLTVAVWGSFSQNQSQWWCRKLWQSRSWRICFLTDPQRSSTLWDTHPRQRFQKFLDKWHGLLLVVSGMEHLHGPATAGTLKNRVHLLSYTGCMISTTAYMTWPRQGNLFPLIVFGNWNGFFFCFNSELPFPIQKCLQICNVAFITSGKVKFEHREGALVQSVRQKHSQWTGYVSVFTVQPVILLNSVQCVYISYIK